jgi:hypothetical protein
MDYANLTPTIQTIGETNIQVGGVDSGKFNLIFVFVSNTNFSVCRKGYEIKSSK